MKWGFNFRRYNIETRKEIILNPYYDKNSVKIYHGDALKVLKELPSDSINCCITSPPYYGLRDYGTGIWEGGDVNCNHKRDNKVSDACSTGHSNKELTVGDAIYKSVCPKCGAIRIDQQLGLEETPDDYVDNLVLVFREVKRVLKKDGTFWLNIGDSYNGGSGCHSGGSEKQNSNNGATNSYIPVKKSDGLKPKDLIGIPWRVAFALQKDGWYLRQDIIWNRQNCMPESVTDRCTKSHEYIFLLSKSQKYYFDHDAIQEEATGYDGRKDTMMKGSDKYSVPCVPGQPVHTMAVNGHERWKFKNIQENGEEISCPVRNKRSVWTVNIKPFHGAHFATYPEELITPCVLAGCPKGGVILDPFAGSGTTAYVAKKFQRQAINIELNEEYIGLQEERLMQEYFDLEIEVPVIRKEEVKNAEPDIIQGTLF